MSRWLGKYGSVGIIKIIILNTRVGKKNTKEKFLPVLTLAFDYNLDV